MNFFFSSAMVATLLFLLLPLSLLGDDAKPPATNPELAAADQLYRAGKFAEAEAGYQGVLKNDSKLGACAICGCASWTCAGNVAATED
jgi:hypothetical protein